MNFPNLKLFAGAKLKILGVICDFVDSFFFKSLYEKSKFLSGFNIS